MSPTDRTDFVSSWWMTFSSLRHIAVLMQSSTILLSRVEKLHALLVGGLEEETLHFPSLKSVRCNFLIDAFISWSSFLTCREFVKCTCVEFCQMIFFCLWVLIGWIILTGYEYCIPGRSPLLLHGTVPMLVCVCFTPKFDCYTFCDLPGRRILKCTARHSEMTELKGFRGLFAEARAGVMCTWTNHKVSAVK